MKTILFNKETNKTLGGIRQGSYTGIWNSALSLEPGWTPQHIIELTVVEKDPPEYDPALKRLTWEWIADKKKKTYTKTPVLTDIPQEEILEAQRLKLWPHKQYVKRVKVPQDFIFSDIGPKFHTWFVLEGLPVEKKDEVIYMYCKKILEQHQAIIDNYPLITEENSPWSSEEN